MTANSQVMASLEDRVVDKIVVSDGCWIWSGARSSYGYGSIKVEGKMIGAHRVVWELAHNKSADGLVIRHTCDNPSCVKPDHLVSGTQSDNMIDMHARRRHMKKLSDLDICRIRESSLFGARPRDLEQIYDITASHVSNIVAGRRHHRNTTGLPDLKDTQHG